MKRASRYTGYGTRLRTTGGQARSDRRGGQVPSGGVTPVVPSGWGQAVSRSSERGCSVWWWRMWASLRMETSEK